MSLKLHGWPHFMCSQAFAMFQSVCDSCVIMWCVGGISHPIAWYMVEAYYYAICLREDKRLVWSQWSMATQTCYVCVSGSLVSLQQTQRGSCVVPVYQILTFPSFDVLNGMWFMSLVIESTPIFLTTSSAFLRMTLWLLGFLPSVGGTPLFPLAFCLWYADFSPF